MSAMRFLSHVLALVAAFAIATPVTYQLDTPARASVTTAANAGHIAATHLAGTQPDVLDENDPAWRCWVDGNRMCSSVPLDGPGDRPAVGTNSTSPQVTGVPPVCSTDAECDAYDLARGIAAWT